MDMRVVRLVIEQEITSITFKEEWRDSAVVIYPAGLGKVRDLLPLLPVIKNLNVKFFLDSAMKQSYEDVQILSSLGVYSGIVINENTDWDRLTDLMYYALCGKVPHAPVEPFQYVYDMYQRNTLVDYGVVFFENGEVCKTNNTESAENHREPQSMSWQRFFYEPSACAACAGWRICMGKYAALEDKTGCQTFTIELLNLIETIKFKKNTPYQPLTTNH